MKALTKPCEASAGLSTLRWRMEGLHLMSDERLEQAADFIDAVVVAAAQAVKPELHREYPPRVKTATGRPENEPRPRDPVHLSFTTQRYMHLSPAAIEGAIRLLDQPKPVHGFGDILETPDRGAGCEGQAQPWILPDGTNGC